eukprot:4237196-Lingulodinium_polyedra.AAC.1
MMRLSRPSATATTLKSHARALHAAPELARAWRAQTCDLRAAAAADGRLNRIIAQRFSNAAQRCDRIG